MVITLSYRPRPLQAEIHRGMDTHRFGAVVCHRRFGKSVLAINHLQIAALSCERERPRFAFIAPDLQSGEVHRLGLPRPLFGGHPECQSHASSELSVTYPNGGQVRLFGADNPDSLCGDCTSMGCSLTNTACSRPSIFTEVIRPALSDRQGWALFLGTPAGKNQFYDVIQQAKADPDWYFAEFKASQTGYVDALGTGCGPEGHDGG